MIAYFKMFLTALIPVSLCLLFYILDRKTPFMKLPRFAKQIIFGVFFGAAAIAGTEFGVDINTAVINVRDAAPICAGLIFGAPAGIIAGIIGGVERWFAVLWGGGEYTRIACTVSTILAGFYAAGLRKFMFDDRRPTWGIGGATAVFMETIHLTLVVLTNLSDQENAFNVIKACTLPMMVFNALAVILGILVVTAVSSGFHKNEKNYKKITQQVQAWLLLCIVLAYFVTTYFVFALQSNTARIDAQVVMKVNASDVRADILAASDKTVLSATRKVRDELLADPSAELSDLSKKYGVDEINIVNENGIIYSSTNQEFVNFDMASGKQSSHFLALLNGTDELTQIFQPITYDNGKGDTIYMKYAGAALPQGFVQCGLSKKTFFADLATQIKDIASTRHLWETGYILIADSDGNIVSGKAGKNISSLNDKALKLPTKGEKKDTLLEGEAFGEEVFYMYGLSENYSIITVVPQSEIYFTRDVMTYVNSFMEVLIFAILFALIYILIKKLVVDNIRVVNKSLGKIIKGNLDVMVDVHSSDEFASLSDDINSTVSTLKHYIDEAAARIDKELAFAKSIQHSALPSIFPAYPSIPDFDIYATMDTAKEVGGDFYDFYMVGEKKFGFLIADVSGKGIPAAMFMMKAKTLLKGLSETGMAPNDVFTTANQKLCEENDANMFVTAWLGVLDFENGTLSFANAGHNPPIVINNGKAEYLKSRPGLVLAGMEGVKYRLNEIKLNKGDRIYLYTDGVTEANNAEKELYGEDRLLSLMQSGVSVLEPKEMLAAVKADVDSFVGDAEQFDDITMLSVLYKGSADMIFNEEKTFVAEDESLAAATQFVEDALEKAEVSPKIIMQMAVALEEIFVNVAHYAYKGEKGDVKLSLKICGGEITLSFTDSGFPFNPLKKEDPDITLSAEERQIGGLGIFMVKKSMDDVFYEYKNDNNILTLVKKYE